MFRSYTLIKYSLGLCLLLLFVSGPAVVNLVADDQEKPVVFTVVLKDKDKEVSGILRMHFKQKFEAEWENGIFVIEFNKIEEIKPTEPDKNIVSVKLVSGETAQVKLINSLFLDKTVFGKYEIHLTKINKIVRKK
ncbi:hypothetical protein ACFL27_22580 [candidate division CSSED10-310 bacterium]|uniref:Uncharacterized protein n=1 Tax=candidate division CSSED10-310 bacterium TaxID=2855610 RepID=A0ABV6Z3H2_UNCC1